MKIDKLAQLAEQGFNIADSIPIVSLTTSQCRLVAGLVQLVAAAVFSLIGLVAQVCSEDQKWVDLANRSVEHLKHGLANMGRGLGEFLLACTIIGPLFLLVYQSASSNKFAPMFYKYEAEPVSAPAVEAAV
jgi:hypothetical protein